MTEEKNVLLKIKKQNLSDNKNVKISKLLQECREVEKIDIGDDVSKKIHQTDSRKNS